MANARAKLVPIELDKQRNLLFDFNALAVAEQVTGRNYLDGAVWDNISATDVRALIFAGLQHEDAKVTLLEVGSWIHVGNIRYVSDLIGEANKEAAPKPKEGADPLPAAVTENQSTSSPSGQSDDKTSDSVNATSGG